MNSVFTGKTITLGLIALLALFTFMFIVPNVRNAQQVFKSSAQNPYLPYVRYDELPYQPESTRAVQKEGDEQFADGMISYTQKNYVSAISRLELAVKKSADQPLWWLYLGISYHMNHQVQQAIAALEQAEKLGTSGMKTHARWYLAQSYLADQKADQAIPLLEQIVAEKRERAAIADSLLTQIRPITTKAM